MHKNLQKAKNSIKNPVQKIASNVPIYAMTSFSFQKLANWYSQVQTKAYVSYMSIYIATNNYNKHSALKNQ